MLIGTATRVLPGRNAIQRVYWRTVNSENGFKLLKYNKTCTFDKKYQPSLQITNQLSKSTFV